MLILEGQKDIYMPVKQLSEHSGQATVYICENQKGKKFAGKIYRDLQGLHPLVLRFLAQTRSDSYVRLVDYGIVQYKDEKRAFELYEYLPGDNMSKSAPYTADFIEHTLLPQLNESLHSLHEAGFLHRDVKSDNFYLRKNPDGNYQVLLGDFGICVPMDESNTYADGGMAFTPGYVPAEVLGSGSYSPASDYYALAVSVYYLLTGKQIFEGMSPDEIMVKTRRGEIASFDGVGGRLATLLEGLMVQDPRYRWGYKEVRAFLGGANVPVFRYGQAEQILDPPYQLTAKVACVSLKDLADNLRIYPEEGKKHLYEGLFAERFRREYQHVVSVLTDITVRKFPHKKNAGLAACIHLFDQEAQGLFFGDRTYLNLGEITDRVAKELAGGILSAQMEEMLNSGILSYFFADQLEKGKRSKLAELEKLAGSNILKAASEFVLELSDEIYYQINPETRIYSIKEYIDYLGGCQENVDGQIYRDFNREYFASWMDKLGHRIAFSEWRSYFYKGEHVLADENIVGNACQFLERICPEGAATLREFVFREIERSPEYWLLGNVALYEMDDMMVQMVQDNFETVICDEDMNIPELMRKRHEMREYMYELRRDFLNNPELYRQGTYDALEYRIFSKHPDAYFVENSNYELVPIGWMRELGSLQSRVQIEQGCDRFKEEAEKSIACLEEKITGMADDVRDNCQTLRRRKKVPGIFGGVAAILFSLCILWVWSKMFGQFHVKSGLLTLGSFAAVFLLSALTLVAGVYRLELVRLWNVLRKQEDKLREVAGKVAFAKKHLHNIEKIRYDDGLLLAPAQENLEMTACEEYAKAKYLFSVKKLKNGVGRFICLVMVAYLLLIGGLYLDGKVKFTKSFWRKEIQYVMTPSLQLPTAFLGEQKEHEKTAKVIVGSARLRGGPGTDFEILNSYVKGSQVELTGERQSDGSDIWYQVLTEDGILGWMRSDTIK